MCETMIEAEAGPVAAVGPQEPLGIVEVALVFGLPLFVVLAAVTSWWSVARVEDGVEAQLVAGLTEAGVDPGEVAIDVRYRDGSLSGTLPAGVDPDTWADAVGGDLLRHLDIESLVAAPLPEIPVELGLVEEATGPVEIDAVYDGMMLTVTGTVLSEGQHNVVLETLDLLTGRAEIDERVVISRLAPEVEGVEARIADLVTAMESMDLADEWSIHLTDRGLTIEAVVADSGAAAAVGALDDLLISTPTTVELTRPDPVGGT